MALYQCEWKTPGGSCYDVLLTNASSQAEAISNAKYKAWATNVGIRCPKESIVVLSAVVVDSLADRFC